MWPQSSKFKFKFKFTGLDTLSTSQTKRADFQKTMIEVQQILNNEDIFLDAFDSSVGIRVRKLTDKKIEQYVSWAPRVYTGIILFSCISMALLHTHHPQVTINLIVSIAVSLIILMVSLTFLLLQLIYGRDITKAMIFALNRGLEKRKNYPSTQLTRFFSELLKKDDSNSIYIFACYEFVKNLDKKNLLNKGLKALITSNSFKIMSEDESYSVYQI